MCGITGFWQPTNFSADTARSIAEKMADRITHRGPDDWNVWMDANVGLVLAHRRLSILELSSAGNQPMISACGRYVIVFNGEIYNHLDLRRELTERGDAPLWRGHADTETLLACFSAWGVDRTLLATVGMFALALWDIQNRVLTLARDRMGEKPLYYGWQAGVLLFGSELKALKAHPAFRANVNRNALPLLLRHNCIPAPYSIYQGIQKLMPGHYLSIPLSDGFAAQSVSPQAWWRYNNVVTNGLAKPFTGSDTEAIDELEAQLSSSVLAQMLADVPVGALLSGGIDSSTIVALMQSQSSQPVHTFTIGVHAASNEAEYAKAVARHLGTNHTELYVTSEDARAVIPKLPAIYCEPFSDSSQIPTFLVCQLAGRHVKVALSGDAGDEIFCGYNRYLTARRVWHKMSRLPILVRRAAAGTLRAFAPGMWDKLFSAISPLLPKGLRIATPGDKAQKLSDVLTISDSHAFYRQLTSHWHDPLAVVIGAQEPQTLLTNPSAWPKTDNFEHWMMAVDAQTYMTDDILVKVDRAAMANSLETRVPILDHRVIELAWRIPMHQKVREGQGKWLLRQVLYRHVPKELIERPKMGFSIPLNSWLRGPLRDWCEDLLDETRLRQEGYFRPAPIRRMWAEHFSGRRNWAYHLWDVLMFQAWIENEKK
jgi:asparagine synthase (glutamine-hydrolysing)